MNPSKSQGKKSSLDCMTCGPFFMGRKFVSGYLLGETTPSRMRFLRVPESPSHRNRVHRSATIWISYGVSSLPIVKMFPFCIRPSNSEVDSVAAGSIGCCTFLARVESRLAPEELGHSDLRVRQFHGLLPESAIQGKLVNLNRFSNFGTTRIRVGGFLQFWEHAGQDFEPEVALVVEAIGASL